MGGRDGFRRGRARRVRLPDAGVLAGAVRGNTTSGPRSTREARRVEGRRRGVRRNTTTTTRGATNTTAEANAEARLLRRGLLVRPLLLLLRLHTRQRHHATTASFAQDTAAEPSNASIPVPAHRVETTARRRQDEATPRSAAVVKVGAVAEVVVVVASKMVVPRAKNPNPIADY